MCQSASADSKGLPAYILRLKDPRLNRGTLASEIINDLGVIILYYQNICNCYPELNPELKEKEDDKPHDIIMNDTAYLFYSIFHKFL